MHGWPQLPCYVHTRAQALFRHVANLYEKVSTTRVTQRIRSTDLVRALCRAMSLKLERATTTPFFLVGFWL